MITTVPAWVQWTESAELAQGLAVQIAAEIAQVLDRRDVCRLVLTGGRTPQLLYQQLARLDIDWTRCELFISDERCLPRDDNERNSLMIEKKLLSHLSGPGPRLMMMQAELGAAAAAEAYRPLIDQALPFDLVILGIGEDGHVASLFPGMPYTDNTYVQAVYDAPKAPPERVSLGYDALARTRLMIVLVTGAAKAAALRTWREGSPLPASRVVAACTGRVEVHYDQASATP